MCILLDLVEVPQSHTGMALVEEFRQVLGEFGVVKKVSGHTSTNSEALTLVAALGYHRRQREHK
jgi:hypothetical protein